MIETLNKQAAELSAGLDYYKPTMSRLVYQQEPNVQVTYTLHNRGSQRIIDYVDPEQLQADFDALSGRGWTKAETQFLGSLTMNGDQPVFSQSHLDYLGKSQLPPVEVYQDPATDDLAIETVGDWPVAIFWETVVMSEVSEAYFENYLLSHNISPIDVYNEGDRRLSEKIKVLQDHPDIKIADFGTRRRFSLKWHEHVLERLVDECPDSLVGTSNVALAQKYGLKPIGTFAHELPMVYAALADVRGQNVRRSHSQFLDDWYRCYGKDYSIALTDTFGTDFFFQDFTPRQANLWRGFRQDSGDPFSFGEQAIDFYRNLGIDPKTKLIVFSDNLNFKKIVELKEHFNGRINDMDGVGTNLTNDVGIPALNIVMKATRVEIPEGDAKTVKMSDDDGKQTGPPQLIDEYRHQYFRAA